MTCHIRPDIQNITVIYDSHTGTFIPWDYASMEVSTFLVPITILQAVSDVFFSTQNYMVRLRVFLVKL
jgi:hypothetical protein